MVIIIMHKGLAYRKGMGGGWIWGEAEFFTSSSFFLTTSPRFKWFCSITANHWNPGRPQMGGCLSTKGLEALWSTLEKVSSESVCFLPCWSVGLAECIIRAGVWVTVIIRHFFYLWSTGATVIRLCLWLIFASMCTCDHGQQMENMGPRRALMTWNISLAKVLNSQASIYSNYRRNLTDSLHISMKLFQNGGWGRT